MTASGLNPVDTAIELVGGMTSSCTAKRQVKLILDSWCIGLRVAELDAEPFYDERHGLVLAIRLPDEASLQSVSRWMAQPMVKSALQEVWSSISAEDGEKLYVPERAEKILELFQQGGLLDPSREVRDIWSMN